MIRKIFYLAGAFTLVTLIAAGFTINMPANSTTSAAPVPTAAQGCNFPINITKIDVRGRKPGGGRDVGVFWQAPANLPNCVSVSEYKVYVKLVLPNTTHDKEITVDGSRTSSAVAVPGFPTNRDPESVTATVTAVLKTSATAKGSKSEKITITP